MVKISDTTKWFIYLLIDPRVMSGRAQDEVRYVGVTIEPNDRLGRHLKYVRNGSTYHSHRWIRQVIEDGLIPTIKLVDEGFGESWEEAETFWIRFYREEVGANLTNMTDGGEGVFGYRHSTETRNLMSSIQKDINEFKRERKKRVPKDNILADLFVDVSTGAW